MGFSTDENSEYNDKGGDFTPPAERCFHPVYVTQAKPDTVKSGRNRGKPKLNFRFTVVGGGEEDGKHVWANVGLYPGRFGYAQLVSICNALGVVGIDDDAENGLDPDDIESVRRIFFEQESVLELKVEHNEVDSGKVFANVVEYRKATDSTLKELKALYSQDGDEFHAPELPDDWSEGLDPDSPM